MNTFRIKTNTGAQNQRSAGIVHLGTIPHARLTPVPAALCFLICLFLMNAAFGQPIDYADEAAVTNYVRQFLYWSDAGTNQTQAAFRYKQLLYGVENNSIRARFETMASLYGDAERARSAAAEEHLRRGLTNHPNSVVLGNLLLDIYYDRTVAENAFARQAVADADFIRFQVNPDPPAFVLDHELPAWELALGMSRQALYTYLELLTNHLGMSSDPATPRGCEIFRQLVPARDLAPASYLSNGVPLLVINDPAPLFSGYKDLVLLYGLLRDYGRVADTLTRHYLARGWSVDLADAEALVTEAQRFIFLHGRLLQGLFPDLESGGADADSGLVEAQAAWEKTLSALEKHRQYLEGEANLLGFAPDFLMLIGKQSTYFDSFDSFESLLKPDSSTSELKLALDALANARDSYAEYRGFEDQLRDAYDSISETAASRLEEIVGVRPGQPGYETNHVGSEAWQQEQSIQIARLQIQRNQTEISNLKEEVQIEIDRRGQEQGVNNAIADVQIRYGNKQSDITQVIGHIEAAQALANAAAEAANADWTAPWGAAASVANGVAQAAAEEAKGQLNAWKERVAAQEAAEITSLNDQLLNVNSKALIKSLWLQMNTLVVDSQEATLQLVQEQGRMVALAREKANLEAILAESDSTLSERYFADPSHRLRLQSDLVLADLHFAEAQKWLFFMLRALEYKWNEPFSQTYPGLDGWSWDAHSVFELRNANELEILYQAMVAFDTLRQLPSDDYFDWFSVREDFFGYTNGPSATYPDPITGLPVGAIEAFRSRLTLLTNANPGYITLHFSTVRPGGSAGTFFRGPSYNPITGDPIVPGDYLDKIAYMRINLPGTHPTNQVTLGGTLRYGGISYIRNPQPGNYDLNHPDRLQNELTSYSSRFWYFSGGQWRFTEEQSGTVTMTLSQNSQVPPSVQEIDLFKERSVATSRWTLLIPIQGNPSVSIGNMNDVEIEFYHRFFTRQL